MMKSSSPKVCICLFLIGVACSNERGYAKTASPGSCQTVGSAELHQVLFDGRNIESVETLKERPLVVRPSPLKTATGERAAKVVGVRVLLRPAAGITAERLELLANCDRATAQSETSTEHDSRCPFGVRGTSTTVSSTGMGFAADVAANDPDAAQELVRRAEALARRGLHAQ